MALSFSAYACIVSRRKKKRAAVAASGGGRSGTKGGGMSNGERCKHRAIDRALPFSPARWAQQHDLRAPN